MALVQQHCAWRRGRELDSERAVQFVRAHASWTRRGLERAGDPAAVALVLGRHHAQHANWITLIAALRDTLGAGTAARAELAYALHGRAAGVLEAARAPGLQPRLAQQARLALIDELMTVTRALVREIRQLAPPHTEVVLDG